jgi:predicted exporter
LRPSAELFGAVHGITLAFGFTLIGVAQDYPLHL